MRIIVCGDSYMTRDSRELANGKHFSELLSPHEVINLARGGMSNIGICFQLEQAVRLQPDIIIIGTTDSGRIEIPSGNGTFNSRQGLKNIVYTHFSSASIDSEYVGDAFAPIISDTIPTIVGEEEDLIKSYSLSKEVRQAVKQYFAHIYHPEVKSLADSWAIGYWIMQLERKGIKVILARETLTHLYTSAMTNPGNWVFHTSFDEQEKAADIIKEII
jgi:hypothetical protein